MKINIFNQQSDLPISLSKVRQLAKEVVAFEKFSFEEASIHFVDIKTISALHDQYFCDPSPTDCISFPMDNFDQPGYKVLGDVFVCPKVALSYASIHNEDPYREMTLYVIHGLLHLLGYDDLDEISRKKMRRAEGKHLKHLEEKNLILTKKH